jgi:hypothetical protein
MLLVVVCVVVMCNMYILACQALSTSSCLRAGVHTHTVQHLGFIFFPDVTRFHTSFSCFAAHLCIGGCPVMCPCALLFSAFSACFHWHAEHGLASQVLSLSRAVEEFNRAQTARSQPPVWSEQVALLDACTAAVRGLQHKPQEEGSAEVQHELPGCAFGAVPVGCVSFYVGAEELEGMRGEGGAAREPPCPPSPPSLCIF